MHTQENLIKLSRKDGKWGHSSRTSNYRSKVVPCSLQTEAGDIVNASMQGATEEPIEAGYLCSLLKLTI